MHSQQVLQNLFSKPIRAKTAKQQLNT